jgi:hypothetical protein
MVNLLHACPSRLLFIASGWAVTYHSSLITYHLPGTMERTVTIDGKEYPVRFNMSTLIAFEQTSDKSFFGENFDKLYSRVILVFAAMFAADEKITTDVLLKSNDWQGITKAFNTIMEMAAEFFKVPKIVGDAEAKEITTDKGEKAEKN